MKKIAVLLLVIIMMLSMVVGCAKPAEQAEEAPAKAEEVKEEAVEAIEWKICNGAPDTHPQSIALARLAEEFEAATNGRVKIEVHFNNALGNEEELTELTRTNTIQGFFGNVTSGLPSFMEEFGVFALPFLFQSYDDAHKYLMESPKQQEMWAELEAMTNLHFIGDSLNGSRALTTKDIIVNGPEDLDGVLVRSMTAQVWQDVISALGATPVPIAYTELYVALQTGVVDGQDNGISNVYSAKMYEVQNYFYDTQHSYTLSAFLVNSDAWAELSAEEQTTFNELFEKYCIDQYAIDMEAYNAEGIEVCKEAGMTFVSQDELDMEAFYANGAALIDEKYMTNEVYAPVITDIREFLGY